MAIPLCESHFVPLPSQTNVYNYTSFELGDGSRKVLVGSLQGKVTCFEYHSEQPIVTDVAFSYIPTDAEIVAIDAFVRPPNGVLVGITLIKQEGMSRMQFLNVYGSHTDPRDSFDWARLVEDFQPCSLDFLPYHLTHAKLKGETVFLLSGGDRRVHLYRLYPEDQLKVFEEDEKLSDFLPEICDFQLNSCIMRLDIHETENLRITALGCQDGLVYLSKVDLKTNCVLQKWQSTRLDGPITSLKLFEENVTLPLDVERALVRLPSVDPSRDHKLSSKANDVHLVVGCAIELAAVYKSVISMGLDLPIPLPSSDQYDSVLTVTAADVNWNNKNEILVGTYGQKLLIYEYQEYKSSSNTVSTDKFILSAEFEFPYPVYSVDYVDLTGDGMKELVTTSLCGIHILQHDLNLAKSHCKMRLQQLQEIRVI
jgi:hypothetical protein